MPSVRNTIILSDVHLCGVMPGNGPWMPYRQRDFLFDNDLAALLDSAVSWSSGASLEIIFNGDMFDFDAPDIRSMAPGTLPSSVSHTEAGAASLIGSILDDHPVVVNAISRCIKAGCTVVFVPGNHDAQLAFPAVRQTIVQRLSPANPSAIRFASWFYRTPDGFHIEHGHQYDPVCMLENMLPSGQLEETVGSVASYHVPAILGCINPYAIDPFDIRPADVFASAVECGKHRPVSPQWYAIATTRFIRQISSVGPSPLPVTKDALHQIAARETGANAASLEQHSSLFPPKKSLDHFAAMDGWRGYGVDTDRRLRSAAVEISRIHAPSGVVMGHTHRPYSVWMNGKFFGNTGSWAPRNTKPNASTKSLPLPPGSCLTDQATGVSGSFVWISSTPQTASTPPSSKVGTYHFLRKTGSSPARILQICQSSG